MTSYQIFDRTLLRRRLQRVKEHDNFLNDIAVTRLHERMMDVSRDFDIVLETGTHNNSVSKTLTDQKKIKTLIKNSLVKNRNTDITSDEEFLPFRENSFDLVLSVMNLHSANDLPGALIQLGRALKPDGLFLGIMLGGSTLHELRSVMMEAELEILGGASPRVAPMVDLRDAAGLLQRARFALPVADSETMHVVYRDLFHLMQDLQSMAMNNCLIDRYKKFTPRRFFMRAAELYQAKFPDSETGGITATFELVHLTGWRPHDSQPLPKKRGSATVSLKDIL